MLLLLLLLLFLLLVSLLLLLLVVVVVLVLLILMGMSAVCVCCVLDGLLCCCLCVSLSLSLSFPRARVCPAAVCCFMLLCCWSHTANMDPGQSTFAAWATRPLQQNVPIHLGVRRARGCAVACPTSFTDPYITALCAPPPPPVRDSPSPPSIVLSLAIHCPFTVLSPPFSPPR